MERLPCRDDLAQRGRLAGPGGTPDEEVVADGDDAAAAGSRSSAPSPTRRPRPVSSRRPHRHAAASCSASTISGRTSIGGRPTPSVRTARPASGSRIVDDLRGQARTRPARAGPGCRAAARCAARPIGRLPGRRRGTPSARRSWPAPPPTSRRSSHSTPRRRPDPRRAPDRSTGRRVARPTPRPSITTSTGGVRPPRNVRSSIVAGESAQQPVESLRLADPDHPAAGREVRERIERRLPASVDDVQLRLVVDGAGTRRRSVRAVVVVPEPNPPTSSRLPLVRSHRRGRRAWARRVVHQPEVVQGPGSRHG